MKILIRLLVIIAVFLLGVDSTFAGGGTRNGTDGATELLIPVGTRGISLAGSSIATETGLGALYWNPAGVSVMNNSVTAEFSHMNYIADIGVEYGAVGVKLENFGVIALDLKALNVGNINVTTVDQPDGTGQTYSPQFLTFGATYSRELTDRIAVGLTFNYISETIAQVSATGFAFNVGIRYSDFVDVKGLDIGIVVKNVGPQMAFTGPGLLVTASPTGSISSPSTAFDRGPTQYSVNAASFDLPSSFDVGVGYSPYIDEMNSIKISGVYENNNYSGDVYNLGAEYGYNKMFFVRVGYSMSPKNQDPNYIYGFTAGAGVDYNLGGIEARIDYAYRAVKYFTGNNVFTISLGF